MLAYLLWWFCGNFTFIQDILVSLGVVSCLMEIKYVAQCSNHEKTILSVKRREKLLDASKVKLRIFFRVLQRN